MALDRDQVGLLFKVSADTADAVQAFSLLRGVVEGMAAETSEQLQRMASRFSAVGDQVRQTGQQFRESFGDAARGQLAGYVGQFGLLGDAAADLIPNLTGTAAALAGVAGGLVAVGAGLTAATLQTTDYAGALNDLADVSNLELETLQGLKAGAALVGESFESLTTSTVIFQKNIEAAKNGNQELAGTFKALGVDLTGSVDDAFRQAIEQLSRMEDGSQKTAVSTELFGKQATSLLKIMQEMDGQYSNLITKAGEFGVLLTTEEIKAADEFGKQLDILKIKAEGFAFAIGNKVIQSLNFFREKLILMGLVESDVAREQAAAIARLEAVDTAAGTPTIDVATALEQQRRERAAAAARSRASGAAQLVNLPSGDAVKRIYDSYIASILTEERRVSAERERLRIAALDGEEARLIDQARRLEEQITQARLQALQMGTDLIQGRLIQGRLDVLQAEATATQGKLDEIRAKRDADLEAQYAKEVDDYRKKEEAKRQEEERSYQNSVRLNQALQAMFEEGRRQRTESLAADPSSPLSLMGPEAQKAADRGAGIFGQLGASAGAAITEVRKGMGDLGTMMTDVFGGIANGLQSMLQGFIMTGKLGGAAFKAMAAQIISSLTAQAAVKAIFELAEGFAATAQIPLDPTGTAALRAASHFTAAKFYGTVAGVAAAASVGLAAIGGGGGGDNGTMFLGQDRRSGSAVMEQGGRRATEPQVIIIRAETEPGVMVSKFVQDYRANGEARSVLRRDLLGEF
jgi:hypothetical protein